MRQLPWMRTNFWVPKRFFGIFQTTNGWENVRYIIENKSKSGVQWWREGRGTKMNVKSSLINYWRPLIHGISFRIKKGISFRIKKGSAKNRRKFQTKLNTPSCAWETQKRTRLSRKKKRWQLAEACDANLIWSISSKCTSLL